MTISSTGTGNITLAAADTGYQTFAQAGISDGDVIRYIVEDASNAWEIGTAVVSNSSTVLARTVDESSNSGNALNLTSAAKVFVGITALDLDGNVAPRFLTTPPTTLSLNSDGSTAVTLNVKAYDEQAFPVNYTWDANIAGSNTIYDASSLPPQFASAPSINQNTGVFSIIGSSNSSNAGTVNLRAKASDGVMTSTHVTACSLEFMYQTNLVGWYDADSYTTGTTIADKSGNSGPALTLHTGVTGSTVYNSSGTGSLPSFTCSGYYSFQTTHNFGTGQSVVLILRMSADGTIGLNGNAAGGTAGMFIQNFSASANLYGSSWQTASAASEIFVDKTSYGTGTTPTRPQIRTALIGTGVTSATALKYHSLVQTGLDLSAGFTAGTSYALSGEIRAILIYNQALTAAQVASIHDSYKSGYPSSADMPA